MVDLDDDSVNNHMIKNDLALIIQLPTLIKALTASDGARILEVEASCEAVDLEGDVVLQSALLDAAPYFVKNGMIDLEHYGEIGERLGIADPISYIIGRPLSVTDLGGKRTGVRAEIKRSRDGSFDPKNNRYDSFWKSLEAEPPTIWYSSIFAFPTEWDNCAKTACSHGATRYMIKAMEWHSLAMTRHPMNDKLIGSAKIVKAEQYIALAKSRLDMLPIAPIPDRLGQGIVNPDVYLVNSEDGERFDGNVPRSMQELRLHHEMHIGKDCPFAGPGIISRNCFQQHFETCSGIDHDTADMLSHALTMMLISDRNF